MNELRSLLADTTDRVLKELPATGFADSWARIAETGLAKVLVGEDAGGFAGNWEDALVVIRATGYYATDLPLADAILASRLFADAQLAISDGVLALGAAAQGELRGESFTGTLRLAAHGRHAEHVAGLIEQNGRALLIVAKASEARKLDQHQSLAGEARDNFEFVDAHVVSAPLATWNQDKLFHYFALLRAGQTGGALQAALDLSVEYTRDRKQFGKPLASFQAIQQQLAVFAEESAAAGMAAAAAFRAADKGDALFEIACAKLRANQAVGVATSIAHQVHGAIGFTAEYRLHHFTRRLWAWQSEFGTERHWADEIGKHIAAQGANAFWPGLVGS